MIGAYPQTVTYWEKTGENGYGQETFESPVTLSAFWRDTNEYDIEYEGNGEPSKSVVYVQQDLAMGSYLALGDQTANASPDNVADAFVIRLFDKLPSIDGTEYIRKAIL